MSIAQSRRESCATMERVNQAKAKGIADKAIAAANLEGKILSIWSCDTKSYKVDVSKFAALADLPTKELEKFEISASGTRISWPKVDVDLSLESIRVGADPELRAKKLYEAVRFDARYSKAIKRLRERRGLSQRDIAGVDPRVIRRIENEGRVPRMATLEKFAQAHNSTLEEYLANLASNLE